MCFDLEQHLRNTPVCRRVTLIVNKPTRNESQPYFDKSTITFTTLAIFYLTQYDMNLNNILDVFDTF